ncbi:hypothetical protein K432DRAFT_360064 [Lepidopterella palustris CBS 459.81]|uniref:Proteasome inhibitor PI31 subunit n=1 Tax=Lepidopterella palustris CBS 459.81 TaxID=1314670 RepID=A0A8E2E3C2_9PEZI|nr:hypothetical protein K432DRAFT_360064 [Lepidopterella palustris CBS 459.81]
MVAPNTARNPLSAGSLATFMAASLPKGAAPPLKNPYDAVALAVHAGMVAVGFRLVGLGEDHQIAQSDSSDPKPLPAAWNATTSYAFRYAHSQSAMEYLLKVTRLGGKAIVLGMALGDDKTTTFEVAVKDYISESSIPSSPFSTDTSTEEASKILQDVFISAGRLNDLGALLKITIIQKLAPGLQKDGYEETNTQEGASETRGGRQHRSPSPREPERPRHDPLRDDPQPEPARPYPFNDPLSVRPDPRRPLPEPIPGFEDEYEINARRRGMGQGGRNPLTIGQDDLYPPGLGPNDPIRPYFGVGGELPRPGFGGGMHPTFDDPLFGGQGQGAPYDPMAPPGSRYDPVGPGGAPRDGRMGPRFPGGGGMGGGPPNPFGGFGGNDFI